MSEHPNAVPVGDSTPSLLAILREVHMLESASHPNIIAYHHAWLETAAPTQSRFVPKVPTLHILMEFANGGSLQGFVDARKGSPTAASEGGGGEGGEEMDGHGAARAARRRRKEARGQAVHLLRLDDILNLFEEVVRGLAFLHGRNILHLDLKVRAHAQAGTQGTPVYELTLVSVEQAENVLLHWEENSLLPTCKLSDFGSASSDSYHRERSTFAS
jgi:serine/threonine protein kinase